MSAHDINELHRMKELFEGESREYERGYQAGWAAAIRSANQLHPALGHAPRHPASAADYVAAAPQEP